jgi:glycosyltransferase involved in cell wall biosynthesis
VISVLVLTKNEEQDLPGCLASVAWSDDVHVLDSMSTDRTVEVAREHGAQVTERAFDNWAAHQNWALKNVPFRYPWVFYIDADERVTPELRETMQTAVHTPGETVAFQVERRDFLMGTWLRHVQVSAFYMRLFRAEKMRYERLVNPVSIPSGPVGRVRGYLDHFPFSKGISHWITRHNSYSTFEAEQIIEDLRADREGAAEVSLMAALFEKDFHRRRYHQKALFYRLPGRPFAKFLLLFFIKRGFLDGRAGLTYSVLQSVYEYFIVLKTRELRRRGSG